MVLQHTISASKTTGDGYVDGTEFEGDNYFVNISKQINADHKLSLTSFGAPQRHGQRQNRSTIDYVIEMQNVVQNLTLTGVIKMVKLYMLKITFITNLRLL